MKNWKYIEGAKTGNAGITDKEFNSENEMRRWCIEHNYTYTPVGGGYYRLEDDSGKNRNDLEAHVKAGNKTGNEKTGAEEFFKQLSDDVKEREKKDDADIEKVGNAKDKNGKELRVGDIVLVWTSAGERAGKVKAISGDRITVAIRNEGDWSTPGKLADKVSNSKTGNANLETSVEKGKLGLWNWYVHKDGTIVSGGTSSTEANAKEMARKALEKEKVGNKKLKFTDKQDGLKEFVYDEENDKGYIYYDGKLVDTIPHAGQGWLNLIKQKAFSSGVMNKTGKAIGKKVGNSTVSEYNSEIQRLTKKAEQLRRMGQGRQAIEVEKQIEKLGKELSEIGNSASDDKFAYVMREFDEGKLKTPDGKVVTDPAQAKAIAYSESKKTENGLARARKAMNKGITMWKGNDSAYIKEDGTVSYLENNSFETDKDKFESQESAIKELSKQGYVKK